MRLVVLAAAQADLEAAFAYIAAENPQAANRVIGEIITQIDRLADFPEIGRPGRVAGTREWVISRTPYVAVYRLRPGLVQILRVLHGARRWPPEA